MLNFETREIKEHWCEIENSNGYYVSNIGRIKSSDRVHLMKNGRIRGIKGRIISLNKTGSGYLKFALYTNTEKPQHLMVHRLVAKYFVSNPYNKLEVNHKDGNKSNNLFTNLEWVTSSENRIHSYRVLGVIPYTKGKFGKLSKSSKPVTMFDKNGNHLMDFECGRQASEYLGCKHLNAVSVAINCNNGNYKGYKFKYKQNGI